MARESTAARMTSKTASNGVFRESERLLSKPHCDQRDKKNNDPTQRNLNECQIPRFHTEAQQGFKRIPKCVHR